jgi:hypothetical protein
MLRRTAAKAFGAETGSETTTRVRAAPRKDLGPFQSVVEKLLRDLQRELERHSTPGEGTQGTPPFTVSRPRSLPDGIGIVVEGKAASIRLVDTLGGFLRVSIESPSAGSAEEMLSLEVRGGGYQPVRKTSPPAPGLARRRSAFEFTTVGELAGRYARAAADPGGARELCRRALEGS